MGQHLFISTTRYNATYVANVQASLDYQKQQLQQLHSKKRPSKTDIAMITIIATKITKIQSELQDYILAFAA